VSRLEFFLGYWILMAIFTIGFGASIYLYYRLVIKIDEWMKKRKEENEKVSV